MELWNSTCKERRGAGLAGAVLAKLAKFRGTTSGSTLGLPTFPQNLNSTLTNWIFLWSLSQLKKDTGQSTLVTVAFCAAPWYRRLWMAGAVQRLLPRWGLDLHFPYRRGSATGTMPLA